MEFYSGLSITMARNNKAKNKDKRMGKICQENSVLSTSGGKEAK
jgi:hypothetical protein